jgi:hypothetical protein
MRVKTPSSTVCALEARGDRGEERLGGAPACSTSVT